MTILLSTASDAHVELLKANGYRITGRCVAGTAYLIATKKDH